MDHGNTSILRIDGTLSAGRERSNVPSQHLLLEFHSDKRWTFIRNLEVDDINLSKITLGINVDFSGTLIQRDIKKVEVGNHYS